MKRRVTSTTDDKHEAWRPAQCDEAKRRGNETTMLSTTMTTTIGTRAIGATRPAKLARRATVKRSVVVSAQKKIIAGEGETTANGRDVGAAVSALAIAAATVAMPEMAHASGGEFGILEGRSAALLHPIGLGSLYAVTLYAGYLGLQWRRVRTVGDEIAELKATLPADAEAAAGSEASKKIEELSATRKELVAGKFKDKHANLGYLLLAMGVTLSVEGGMNTYLRVGKLFPGPHLYAGATITVLWAMAAGLVPMMEKGNQKARDLHIALNCLNVALFTWQIPTGLEIVGKVFQFTSWP
jgi:hypothetical protein